MKHLSNFDEHLSKSMKKQSHQDGGIVAKSRKNQGDDFQHLSDDMQKQGHLNGGVKADTKGDSNLSTITKDKGKKTSTEMERPNQGDNFQKLSDKMKTQDHVNGGIKAKTRTKQGDSFQNLSHLSKFSDM